MLGTNPQLVSVLATITAAHLTACMVVLGRRYPGYRHRRQTISELGERGSPVARSTAWLCFLPTGLLIWATLWALHHHLPADAMVRQGVTFLALVGLAYVASAFFPCDAGAPMVGSWTNSVHNLVGGVAYLGELAGLSILHRSLEGTPWNALATVSRVAFVVALLGFIGTMTPHPLRGLAQRLGEAAFFGWLIVAGVLVAQG